MDKTVEVTLLIDGSKDTEADRVNGNLIGRLRDTMQAASRVSVTGKAACFANDVGDFETVFLDRPPLLMPKAGLVGSASNLVRALKTFRGTMRCHENPYIDHLLIIHTGLFMDDNSVPKILATLPTNVFVVLVFAGANGVNDELGMLMQKKLMVHGGEPVLDAGIMCITSDRRIDMQGIPDAFRIWQGHQRVSFG